MDTQDLVGSVVAGRYRVEALLGRGAAGAVYRVEHVHIRKRLALKVLHPDTGRSPELVARFEREAVAAANIDHPNVAAATDFGRLEDGAFYLVLEYVEGGTLARAIAGQAMPVARAVAIARQVASALVRAHELGIVHRDLKPDNVLLGDGDVVKVLDFGIAKVHEGELRRRTLANEGEALTRAGLIYGTPEYMAPEQALGETVDARADLWALGVMLFEMLAGRRPFAGDDMAQLLGQIITAPAPRVVDRAPPGTVVPPALEALVARLLAKQPDGRAANAREVLASLDALGGPRASTPPPPGAPATGAGGSDRPPPSAAPVRVGSDAPGGPAPTEQELAETVAALSSHGAAPRVIPVPPAPRRRLYAAAAAGLALSVAAVTLVLRARAPASAGPGLVERGAVSTSAPPLAPDPDVTDDEVRRAEEEGPDAIARLAARAPRDLRVRRAQVQALLAAGHVDEGITALGALLDAMPEAATSADPGPALAAAAATAAAQGNDPALALLGTRLGPRGVDTLYDLANKPGAARARAERALARPEVRAHASPALLVVLDLRSAAGCEAKYALLARARQHGDARALPLLRPLTATKGCGFLNLNDCWRCLRRDGALRDALAAIEGRR